MDSATPLRAAQNDGVILRVSARGEIAGKKWAIRPAFHAFGGLRFAYPPYDLRAADCRPYTLGMTTF